MMPSVTTAPGAPGFVDPGIQKLLGSLDQLESKAEGSRPDLQFLKTLLESSDFMNLLRVHDMVTTPEAKDPPPIYENASDLVTEVDDLLSRLSPMPEAEELSEILHNPHFTALLDAHDTIALKEFQPQLPEVPHEVDEDEESVKIVRLVKGPEEPLGATIQMDEETGKIKIARVMCGGAADRSGVIHTGDEVHEVNKIKVAGKTPTEVVKILSGSVGPITLKLVPGDLDPNNDRESKVFMRALFDYNPNEDKYIPCREAGLTFQKGDILNIVCQDDPNWWQAKKVCDKSLRAGLIPGKQLQERKEVLKVTVHGEPSVKETKNSKTNGKFSPKLGKKNKKSKKILNVTGQNEDGSSDEISFYEEVDNCCPETAINRTVILVGPSGVGTSTLQSHLVNNNPGHFRVPPLCTSRPRKSSESDSDNMIHISRQEMEKDILNKKYFEHWELKGHLHGTSIEHIRNVYKSSHTPVLTCAQPHLIHTLWSADIKPYCILVKPPPFAELKATRTEAKAKYNPDDKHPRSFLDEEFHDMVQSSELMESGYAHYFGHTLVNGNLSQAKDDLLAAVEKMGSDPQWVPTSWLKS